jgi:hypothetical protein
VGEYDAALETAARIIRKKGRGVVLRYVTDGAPPDPARPWKPGPPIDVDHPTYGVFGEAEQSDASDGLVKVGDDKVLVAALGLPAAPTTKVVLLDGGVARDVYKVGEIRPGLQAVYYELFLRSG